MTTRSRMATWLTPALALLCLDGGAANADAPLGRYTISAQLVVDNKTKLTWQRAGDGPARSQSEASSYCATLTLDGAGGFRLPTALELRSLIDVTNIAPAIDRRAFPQTPNAFFWTSTPYHPTNGWMWYVDFIDGGASGRPAGDPHRVRCVR